MKKELILTKLNNEQITRAKEENGSRKQITHALVVGHYGIIFGTYKQCEKYYIAWRDLFINLFKDSYETSSIELPYYKTDNGIVYKLCDDDKIRKRGKYSDIYIEMEKEKARKNIQPLSQKTNNSFTSYIVVCIVLIALYMLFS